MADDEGAPPAHEGNDSEAVDRFPVLDIPLDALSPIADRAAYEWHEEGGMWIATIPDVRFRGGIATGETHRACHDELVSVLREWLSLGHWQRRELPPIEGVDFAHLASH
jgi:hypothetical protein